MAVIDPQTAIDAAQPWCCVPQGDLWYAVLGALIAVGNGDPMPTAQELMDDIACLKCATQPGDLPLLILGAVDSIASGGGGGGGVTCGNGPPVGAPATSCALYIDKDTQIIYQGFDGAWH